MDTDKLSGFKTLNFDDILIFTQKKMQNVRFFITLIIFKRFRGSQGLRGWIF